MSEKQVVTSEQGLLDLAENVRETIETLKKCNNELSGNLSRLGKTFRDEGYKIVCDYVEKAEEIIIKNEPNVKKVVNQLIAYARLIHISRTAL